MNEKFCGISLIYHNFGQLRVFCEIFSFPFHASKILLCFRLLDCLVTYRARQLREQNSQTSKIVIIFLVLKNYSDTTRLFFSVI
jgi:hypothetical protein